MGSLKPLTGAASAEGKKMNPALARLILAGQPREGPAEVLVSEVGGGLTHNGLACGIARFGRILALVAAIPAIGIGLALTPYS